MFVCNMAASFILEYGVRIVAKVSHRVVWQACQGRHDSRACRRHDARRVPRRSEALRVRFPDLHGTQSHRDDAYRREAGTRRSHRDHRPRSAGRLCVCDDASRHRQLLRARVGDLLQCDARRIPAILATLARRHVGDDARVQDRVQLTIMSASFVLCTLSTLGMLCTCFCCVSQPSTLHEQAASAARGRRDANLSTLTEPRSELVVDFAPTPPAAVVVLLDAPAPPDVQSGAV